MGAAPQDPVMEITRCGRGQQGCVSARCVLGRGLPRPPRVRHRGATCSPRVRGPHVWCVSKSFVNTTAVPSALRVAGRGLSHF